MKMQLAVALAAVLGLSGCGGGGSGSDDTGVSTGGVTAAQLVGTWVQTNNIYFESTPGNWVWVRTSRQTIVVEQSGSGLLFTNCVSGDSLDGSVSNNAVTFPVQPDVAQAFALEVVDANTITGTVTLSGISSEADVELLKVSGDTTIEVASANLTVTALTPIPVTVTRSSWDQLCVESQLQADEYFAEVRGRIGSSIDVSMRFDSFSPFVAGTNSYPGASMFVSGNFSLSSPQVEGELSDPVSGSVGLGITSQAVDYNITNLEMQSDLGVNVRVNGTINFNSSWLVGEQE